MNDSHSSEDLGATPLRFLCVCLPYAGHIYPTLGTVAALVDAGHDVRCVLDPRWRREVEATGARFIPYDRYPSDPGPVSRSLLAPRRAFATAQRVAAQERYDCLLYEALFSYGKALAVSLGLPAVRLSSTFAYTRQILENLARTGGRHLTSVMRDGPLYRMLSAQAHRKGFLQSADFITEIVDNPPDLTYVYTSRSFQIDAEEFPEERFRFIGPSLEARSSDPTRRPDLDAESPLIYVSMGTLLNRRPRFYRACIAAFADAPVSVVMSIGHGLDPARLGELPHNITVHPWVPQLDVLRHADLFITHGGMNSVNESIYAEVPMLVVPQGNDQPTVADRVEELGLGMRLDPAEATPARLQSASERVLGSQSVSAHVAAISADMRAAGGNARAVEEITRMLTRRR
ncbi:macrolide family glycosyltransferase [Microbacterium sp. 18062]|uniref:macrolide family glycosyltransferase n=1 Tax=Microbacterium sp. 18062 TaxID=2681410 RepID=UPI001357D977|nr:macrolide family glycosyltransferase [Microbacterium sp. 18062]